MPFCINCGEEITEVAKFCHMCGAKVILKKGDAKSKRIVRYEGEKIKCPSCGENIKSFMVSCPSCGHEFRNKKATNSVREFEAKIEKIEAKREYEKPRGIFGIYDSSLRISKADEQKISLIRSFSVPNTKEDIMEFMILATSNINYRLYDSIYNISKGERAINDAWLSKIRQVYDKAKLSYRGDSDFILIQNIYDNCMIDIGRSKKRGIIKWMMLVGWVPLLWIGIIASLVITGPKEDAKELGRLENVVVDVQEALDNGEYKHALRVADSIDYQRYNHEMKRKWEIERDYWIDKVIEEANKNGVILERPKEKTDEEDVEKKTSSVGFIEGLKDGMQPGIGAVQENMEEFNRIMSGDEEVSNQGND